MGITTKMSLHKLVNNKTGNGSALEFAYGCLSLSLSVCVCVWESRDLLKCQTGPGSMAHTHMYIQTHALAIRLIQMPHYFHIFVLYTHIYLAVKKCKNCVKTFTKCSLSISLSLSLSLCVWLCICVWQLDKYQDTHTRFIYGLLLLLLLPRSHFSTLWSPRSA